MHTIVADHPLIAQKITMLRDEATDSPTFRRLADELVTLLAYEATRGIRVVPVEVKTPLTVTAGAFRRLTRARGPVARVAVAAVTDAGAGQLAEERSGGLGQVRRDRGVPGHPARR